MKNILEDAPAPVRKMFDDLWSDMERARRAADERRAKENPVKYRLSREIDGHTGYCYIPAGKDGRGCKVSFCYSTNTNIAGYYLIWRQVEAQKTIKRDQWDSTTSKQSAVRLARRLSDEYRNKKQ